MNTCRLVCSIRPGPESHASALLWRDGFLEDGIKKRRPERGAVNKSKSNQFQTNESASSFYSSRRFLLSDDRYTYRWQQVFRIDWFRPR